MSTTNTHPPSQTTKETGPQGDVEAQEAVGLQAKIQTKQGE